MFVCRDKKVVTFLVNIDAKPFERFGDDAKVVETDIFYFNCRSIMLTLSLVLLTLMILRKIKIPIHGLGKQMVDRSAFIYLSEPFISFVILNYVFGQMKCFSINDIMFFIYQAARIVVLLIIIPLGFMAWDYRNKYHAWTGFLRKRLM